MTIKLGRALVAAVLLAGVTLALPTPARAGGWAATVVDPLPAPVQAGRTYRMGLWLLQHGNHPFSGSAKDLGPVALHLFDETGAAGVFPAVPLTEPAHYAVTVTVPHPGAFTVVAEQGFFGEYRVGTLTVPGTLAQLPATVPLTSDVLDEHWPQGARPPVLPVDKSRNPWSEPRLIDAPAVIPVATGAPAVAVEPVSSRTPPGVPRLAILAGVAVLFVAGTVFFGRRRALAGQARKAAAS